MRRANSLRARNYGNRKIIIRTGISEREFDGAGASLLPGRRRRRRGQPRRRGPCCGGGARRVAVRWGTQSSAAEAAAGTRALLRRARGRTAHHHPARAGSRRAARTWVVRAGGRRGRRAAAAAVVPFHTSRGGSPRAMSSGRAWTDGARTDARTRRTSWGGGTALYAASSHCGAGSSVNGGGRWCTRVVAEADPGEGSGGGGACAKTASGESERRAWSSSDCACAAAGCTGGNDGPRKEAPYGALGGARRAERWESARWVVHGAPGCGLGCGWADAWVRVHARGAVRRRARCAEQWAWGRARVLGMGRQGKWRRRWEAAEVLGLVARWDAWHSGPQERRGELRGRGVRAVGHVRVVVVGVHAVLLRKVSRHGVERERGRTESGSPPPPVGNGPYCGRWPPGVSLWLRGRRDFWRWF